jgi:spore coat protein U-like protein
MRIIKMKKSALIFSFLLTAWLPTALAGSCTLSGGDITFGPYVQTSTVNTTASFYVTCSDSNQYTYCIQISASTSRGMYNTASPTTFLYYQLYRDSTRTNIWQNSACVNVTKSCPASNPCKEVIYGQIPSGQAKSSGLYQDEMVSKLIINSAENSIINSHISSYINSGCNVSADLFNFGVYDPNSISPLDVNQANLHITCTYGLKYSIALSGGYSGNTNNRYMLHYSGSDNKLYYNLYTSSSYTTIWGAIGVSAIGNGTTQNFSIFGRINARQYPQSGFYIDSIIATVSY